jgi:hypothetical protein
LPPSDATATGTERQPQLSPGAVFENLLATQQRLFYSSVCGSAACSHNDDDGDDDDNDESFSGHTAPMATTKPLAPLRHGHKEYTNHSV